MAKSPLPHSHNAWSNDAYRAVINRRSPRPTTKRWSPDRRRRRGQQPAPPGHAQGPGRSTREKPVGRVCMFASRPTPAAVIALCADKLRDGRTDAHCERSRFGVSVLRDVRIMASKATPPDTSDVARSSEFVGSTSSQPRRAMPDPSTASSSVRSTLGPIRISSRGCSIASRGSASASAMVL